MKTKFLTGDIDWIEYGKKLITKKLNNGEFDYYLIIDFMNMEYMTGEKKDEIGYKYMVSIQAVKPKHSEEKLKEVIKCFGYEDEKLSDFNEIALVEMICDYGLMATLWNKTGNNAHELIKEAQKQLEMIESIFGFFMDTPQNYIGNTGWDFIDGRIGFEKQIGVKK